MTTLQEAISAYRTVAAADGKSNKTVSWVCNSSRYLCEFLGQGVDIEEVTTHDVRRWIVALRQQRYDTVAALGYSHARTPNLDRLAREGVAFTRLNELKGTYGRRPW